MKLHSSGEDYLEALDAANQRLYEAGFDRYLEAIQAQLDNYAAGGSEAEAVPSMELAD